MPPPFVHTNQMFFVENFDWIAWDDWQIHSDSIHFTFNLQFSFGKQDKTYFRVMAVPMDESKRGNNKLIGCSYVFHYYFYYLFVLAFVFNLAVTTCSRKPIKASVSIATFSFVWVAVEMESETAQQEKHRFHLSLNVWVLRKWFGIVAKQSRTFA